MHLLGLIPGGRIVSSSGFSPEPDTRYDAHGGEEGEYGRAAVAEKGEGKTDYGRKPNAHSYVFKGLENQHAGKTHANKHAFRVVALDAYIYAAEDDGGKQNDYSEAAYQPQLLARDGEDKVRVLKGQGIGLGLDAAI